MRDGATVFGCRWAGLFIIEVLNSDGQIIGYQAVNSNGDDLSSVGSLKEALAIIQKMLDDFLVDELGFPEDSQGHESPRP